MQIFRVNPFFKLQVQNNCKQQISGEKRDVGHLSTFGLAVLLRCFGVQCLDLVLECWQVAVIFVSDFFESVFSKSNRTKTNEQTNKNKQTKT